MSEHKPVTPDEAAAIFRRLRSSELSNRGESNVSVEDLIRMHVFLVNAKALVEAVAAERDHYRHGRAAAISTYDALRDAVHEALERLEAPKEGT